MWCEPGTYDVLEIDRILAMLAGGCRSALGGNELAHMEPAEDCVALRRRFALLDAYLKCRDANGELPWDGRMTPVAHMLIEVREYGWMSGEELVRVRTLLNVAQKIRERLKKDALTWPQLRELGGMLRDWDEQLKALAVLDDDGRLYDNASAALAKIRSRIFNLRDGAKRRANTIFQDSSLLGMLQERVLSLRGNRYCVLVRMESAASFPGLVVERSQSGSSVYMEPRALTSVNSELAMLAEEERAEEHRILSSITASLVKRGTGVEQTEAALGMIDLFYGMGDRMYKYKWHVPDVSDASVADFKRARHPLLGERAEPLDLCCGDAYRMLVITGPNTGGKTVALKTMGVCIYLAWLGCPVPASEGSVIGQVGRLFADIGDEQSIEQSLSTFSAHVKNLIGMVKSAHPDSMMLLDELGAGTDPDEGSALGIALLDHFRRTNCMVFATTHHNQIKRYALSTEGIETASMEFDAATLSPTYRLRIGIPGRSNALLIAQKLGMPKAIIKGARAALSTSHEDFEALVGELESRKTKLEAELLATRQMSDQASALRKQLEASMKDLQQRRDKAIEEADKKAASIIREAQDGAKELLKTLQNAPRENAQREYESKKKVFDRLDERIERREERRAVRAASEGDTPYVGDMVESPGTGIKGELISISGDSGMVQSGAVRVSMPIKKLVKSQNQKKQEVRSRVQVSTPQGVSSSIMVRGMTVDEAMPIVEQYLDSAYRAGYGEVAVIHGRGEGILRREVQDLCKHTPFVESNRLGGPGEGGYGVTIVKFTK